MFNLIWLIVMFFLLCAICGESGGYSNGSNNNYNRNRSRNSNNNKGNRASGRENFGEADSFFDRHGNEHLLDDYGNCYDCDDQHDF